MSTSYIEYIISGKYGCSCKIVRLIKSCSKFGLNKIKAVYITPGQTVTFRRKLSLESLRGSSSGSASFDCMARPVLSFVKQFMPKQQIS